MFTAENEDVLVAFQALCEQYPRENPVALWEMAGGQIAAQQSAQADATPQKPLRGMVWRTVSRAGNASRYVRNQKPPD